MDLELLSPAAAFPRNWRARQSPSHQAGTMLRRVT
jgi:hypothetical protein